MGGKGGERQGCDPLATQDWLVVYHVQGGSRDKLVSANLYKIMF